MAEQEPDYDKLSPELEAAFRAHREGAGQYLSALSQADKTTQLVPGDGRPAGKPDRIVVSVECEHETSFADITGPEIEINEADGAVRTGIVALAGLPVLARHPGVRYLSVTEPMDLYLDVAGGYLGLPRFRSRRGLTGKGVVVGIVDSGIDAGHPAFTGRVHSVWDQFVEEGKGVEGFPYGKEYTGEQVRLSCDDAGHGTHVCGIAAGKDGKYPGVAPGATIVGVRVKATSVNVQNAIAYVFRTAERLGLPAVVNISMGSQASPHDGSDALCRYIDEVSGPGRIVCCAAGNDGNTGVHGRVVVPAAQPCDVLCGHLPDGARFDPLTIRGYYPASAELEIAVSGGSHATPWQGRGRARTYDLPDGSLIVIDTNTGRPEDRFRPFLLKLLPPEDTKDELYAWRIRLRQEGSGPHEATVDMWAARNGGFRKARCDSHTIGSPGCATTAITVGSFVTRVEWPAGTATAREPDLKVYTVDPQSSKGPRLDGHPKPDVLAPGAVVVSARSSRSSPDRNYIVDKRHVVDQGTSMAAPFLTGIVALLLEEDKSLGAKQVLDRLRYTAVDGTDANTAGRGLVDLKNL